MAHNLTWKVTLSRDVDIRTSPRFISNIRNSDTESDCSLFIDHRIMIIVLYRMLSYLPIVSQSIAPVENMCTLSLVILICLILTGKH